jgi:hypothetical protein
VISGLLAKDPDERLDAAETERMLSEVASLPPSAPADRAPAAQEDVAETNAAEASVPEPPPAEPAEAGSSAIVGSPATEADAAVTAAAPPSGVPPFAAASPASTADRRPRRSRRPALALAALTAVAGTVTAIALALTSSPGRPTGSSAASSATPTLSASSSASGTAPGGRISASATAGSAPASASSPASSVSAPASSGSGSSNGGKTGYGVLAAGYYRFTNSTGFSVGVPDGWQISHVGHYVYITDPSNSGIFLLIDQSDTPNPNPLADWRQQAANRASTYPSYHLIRLESVYYPQAEKAADWEFTYVRNGIPVHILNRNVLANAHHAYALYWSTPESDWNADYHYFQNFAGTFRPAQ